MDGHGCQLQCDLCACGDGGAVLGTMDMATGSGDNMCVKGAQAIDYRDINLHTRSSTCVLRDPKMPAS